MQCGVCANACGYGALAMGEYPEIDEAACRLCSSCVETCPVGALSVEKIERIARKDARGIWVLALFQVGGDLDPVTTELLGEARRLAVESGEKVSALLLGCNVGRFCGELFEKGADCVYVAENRTLACMEENRWASAIAAVAVEHKPSVLLIGATRFGRNVAARVAALLGTGLTADCTALRIDAQTGNLLQCRPAFGGNLMATIVTPDHRPQMASVRPGVMKPIAPRSGFTGSVVSCGVPKCPVAEVVEILSEKIDETKRDSIGDAHVVIGGGRGMQCAANMVLLQELADVVGGVVAGSRAAVEAGWIDFDRQIGQTGRAIAPKLYIACGISGQIQHTAGIVGAEIVVAINNDPSAPIFGRADYGIVGDVVEIVPKLTALLRS